jgi:hypothetical protein
MTEISVLVAGEKKLLRLKCQQRQTEDLELRCAARGRADLWAGFLSGQLEAQGFWHMRNSI